MIISYCEFHRNVSDPHFDLHARNRTPITMPVLYAHRNPPRSLSTIMLIHGVVITRLNTSRLVQISVSKVLPMLK